MDMFIEATPEAGKRFYEAHKDNGKIFMLNLLKFKKVADYSKFPDLAPAQENLTGKEAYELYLEKTRPFLEKAGSEMKFAGQASHFLIGPDAETWDAVLLVEHQSVTKFLEFAQSEEYRKIANHRTAALDDSRLLPITAGL